jgi:hypothetical protein
MEAQQKGDKRDRSGSGTQKELEFLHGIGTHGDKCEIPRGEMLAKYLKASMRRMEWGSINARLVVATACAMLEMEMNASAFRDSRSVMTWRSVREDSIKHFRLNEHNKITRKPLFQLKSSTHEGLNGDT